MLYIKGEEEQLGIIKDYNLPFSSVYGYTKKELVGLSINVLIPVMFRKAHEKSFITYYSNIKSGKNAKVIPIASFEIGRASCRERVSSPV